MIAICTECQKNNESKPFCVPWGDHIGPELMKAHYQEKHPGIKLGK